MSSWRKWSVAALGAMCVAGVVGCGSSSSSSSSSASTSASQPRRRRHRPTRRSRKLVPAAIKSKGTITVAADASYAPNEFIGSDGHTVVGMDPDLMNALAAVMGLKANVVNQTFDSIIPGLTAGKYDVGASSFTDTKDARRQVDFVDYFVAGESFLMKARAVRRSTVWPISAARRSRSRRARPSRPTPRPRAPSARRPASPASRSWRSRTRTAPTWLSRADAPSSGLPTRRSRPIRSRSQTASSSSSARRSPTRRTDLPFRRTAAWRKPMLAALKVLMKNGQYKTILTHWGIQAGAIPAAQVKINGGTS